MSFDLEVKYDRSIGFVSLCILNDICTFILSSVVSWDVLTLFSLSALLNRTRFKVIDKLQANKDKVRTYSILILC